MEKIISNDEIKLYTGLTATNAKLDLFNTAMTELLALSLGINQFTKTEVSLEDVRIDNSEYITLRSFPIDLSTLSLFNPDDHTLELTGYTYRADPYNFRKVLILNDAGKPFNLLFDKVFATYEAGYTLTGTIEVAEIVELLNATLSVTILGVTTNYTFIEDGEEVEAGATEIIIGEDEAATAANIATKLSLIASNTVVYLSLGMSATITQALGEGQEYSLTIINSDVPQDLKMAVAYLVAGSISDKLNIEGVSEYRLGSKSVRMRDMAEKNFIDEVVNKYTSRYKKINVIG